VPSPAPLPTDLAEAHALILQQREELTLAEARASGAAAMIVHLKLMIAKLRRDQYGQSSERGRKMSARSWTRLQPCAGR
jgi:transposase